MHDRLRRWRPASLSPLALVSLVGLLAVIPVPGDRASSPANVLALGAAVSLAAAWCCLWALRARAARRATPHTSWRTLPAMSARGDARHWLVAAAVAAGAAFAGGALSAAPMLLTTNGLGLAALALLGAVLADASLGRPEATRLAVAAERLRLGREVHDGSAQDLAAIVRDARSLAGADIVSPADLERLATAGERALTELRLTMSTLRRAPGTRLAIALVEDAIALSAPSDLTLEVDVLADPRLDPESEHAIRFVAREALSNAIIHGAPARVSICLRFVADGVELRVVDDGCGFEPGHRRHRPGIGLESMQWRARSAGGRLVLDSRPGAGTSVCVTL